MARRAARTPSFRDAWVLEIRATVAGGARILDKIDAVRRRLPAISRARRGDWCRILIRGAEQT
jgi:hypothetical protein